MRLPKGKLKFPYNDSLALGSIPTTAIANHSTRDLVIAKNLARAFRRNGTVNNPT